MTSSLVRWDILGEHLETAESVCASWEAALDWPTLTLRDLERRLERRLFALLDGLALSGRPATHELLLPALFGEGGEAPARRLAAGLALLGQGRSDLVSKALFSEDPEAARPAQRAMGLAGTATLDAWLLQQLSGSLDDRARRALMPVVAARGLWVENVLPSLQSDDEDEARAAAVLARRAEPRRHLPAMDHLATQAESRVRDEALVTLCGYDPAFGLRRCRESKGAGAMRLVALLGTSTDQRALLERGGDAEGRAEALQALGFSGSVVVADALLQPMASEAPPLARAAGAAFARITGADLDDGNPDDEAPAWNLPAIAAWWERHPARANPAARILGGAPWSRESVLHALEMGPLRGRGSLAWWLAVDSGGAVTLPTRAFSYVQIAAIRAARVSHVPARHSA